MRLYILRHAKAESRSDSGRDEDRLLSDRGRAQARGLADLFAATHPPPHLQPRPRVVLTSPAPRADATARIIADAMGLEARHEPALALDTTLKDVLALVERTLEEPGPIVLVGHNPHLSRLVDHLAGADELRTGELSVIDLETLSDAKEIGRARVDV